MTHIRCLLPTSIQVDEHPPNISVTSLYDPEESYRHPSSPVDLPRPAGKSGPGCYEIPTFALGPGALEILCAPLYALEYLFSPVLWSSCDQDPLAFKAKCSGGSSSWCQNLRPGSLMMWTSEPSFLWESPCDIIILQFLDCPLSMGFTACDDMSISPTISFSVVFKLLDVEYIFFFLWPNLQHMEFPGLGVKLELQV